MLLLALLIGYKYRHAVYCIRVLTCCLDVLLHAGGTKEFLVRSSYLEIYNEEVCARLGTVYKAGNNRGGSVGTKAAPGAWAAKSCRSRTSTLCLA